MEEEIDLIKKQTDFLTAVLQDQAKKIARKNGYSEDFVLSVSTTMSMDYHASIHVGQPPKIMINASFALACLSDSSTRKTELRRLAYMINRLLEQVPRFTRSLSNLVPMGFYAALPAESKRFVKTQKKLFVIDETKVAITFTVSATSIETGESITIEFSNPREFEEYKRYAIMKLAKIVPIQKEVEIVSDDTSSKTELDPNKINHGSAVMKSLDFATVRIEYDKEEGNK